MAKKLTVEVDADVSSARRKVKSLSAEIGGGGDSSRVAPSAERAAKSLESTAQSADKLSRRAAEGSANIKQMTKVFGGMAVRMATGFASKQFADGSREQFAVNAGGEAVSGALMGSAFGPLGALAGGIMGLTGAIMEAKAAEEQRALAIASASKSFELSETTYKNNREFADRIKGITTMQKGDTDYEGHLAAISEELNKLHDKEASMVEKVKEFINLGHSTSAGQQREQLGIVRQRIEALESAYDRIKEQRDEHHPTARTSTTALDAMARLGMGGGGESGRESLAVQREMSATLKSIDQKTRPGGGTWQ